MAKQSGSITPPLVRAPLIKLRVVYGERKAAIRTPPTDLLSTFIIKVFTKFNIQPPLDLVELSIDDFQVDMNSQCATYTNDILTLIISKPDGTPPIAATTPTATATTSLSSPSVTATPSSTASDESKEVKTATTLSDTSTPAVASSSEWREDLPEEFRKHIAGFRGNHILLINGLPAGSASHLYRDATRLFHGTWAAIFDFEASTPMRPCLRDAYVGRLENNVGPLYRFVSVGDDIISQNQWISVAGGRSQLLTDKTWLNSDSHTQTSRCIAHLKQKLAGEVNFTVMLLSNNMMNTLNYVLQALLEGVWSKCATVHVVVTEQAKDGYAAKQESFDYLGSSVSRISLSTLIDDQAKLCAPPSILTTAPDDGAYNLPRYADKPAPSLTHVDRQEVGNVFEICYESLETVEREAAYHERPFNHHHHPRTDEEEKTLFLDGARGASWRNLELKHCHDQRHIRTADHVFQTWEDLKRDIRIRLQKVASQTVTSMVASPVVNLYHNRGAGGTTLARRILWDLRKEFICVRVRTIEPEQIKSSIQLIAERVPQTAILVLLDVNEIGLDAQRSTSGIASILHGLRCVFFVVVGSPPTNLTTTLRLDSGNNYFLMPIGRCPSFRRSCIACGTSVDEYTESFTNFLAAWDGQVATRVKQKQETYDSLGLLGYATKWGRLQTIVKDNLKLCPSPRDLAIVQTCAFIHLFSGRVLPGAYFGRLLHMIEKGSGFDKFVILNTEGGEAKLSSEAAEYVCDQQPPHIYADQYKTKKLGMLLGQGAKRLLTEVYEPQTSNSELAMGWRPLHASVSLEVLFQSVVNSRSIGRPGSGAILGSFVIWVIKTFFRRGEDDIILRTIARDLFVGRGGHMEASSGGAKRGMFSSLVQTLLGISLPLSSYNESTPTSSVSSTPPHVRAVSCTYPKKERKMNDRYDRDNGSSPPSTTDQDYALGVDQADPNDIEATKVVLKEVCEHLRDPMLYVQWARLLLYGCRKQPNHAEEALQVLHDGIKLVQFPENSNSHSLHATWCHLHTTKGHALKAIMEKQITEYKGAVTDMLDTTVLHISFVATFRDSLAAFTLGQEPFESNNMAALIGEIEVRVKLYYAIRTLVRTLPKNVMHDEMTVIVEFFRSTRLSWLNDNIGAIHSRLWDVERFLEQSENTPEYVLTHKRWMVQKQHVLKLFGGTTPHEYREHADTLVRSDSTAEDSVYSIARIHYISTELNIWKRALPDRIAQNKEATKKAIESKESPPPVRDFEEEAKAMLINVLPIDRVKNCIAYLYQILQNATRTKLPPSSITVPMTQLMDFSRHEEYRMPPGDIDHIRRLIRYWCSAPAADVRGSPVEAYYYAYVLKFPIHGDSSCWRDPRQTFDESIEACKQQAYKLKDKRAGSLLALDFVGTGRGLDALVSGRYLYYQTKEQRMKRTTQYAESTRSATGSTSVEIGTRSFPTARALNCLRLFNGYIDGSKLKRRGLSYIGIIRLDRDPEIQVLFHQNRSTCRFVSRASKAQLTAWSRVQFYVGLTLQGPMAFEVETRETAAPSVSDATSLKS